MPDIHDAYLLEGEKKTARERPQQNGHVPIQQLPNEVLLDIIDEHLATHSAKRHYKAMHALARVCFRWLEVIKNTYVV